MSEKGERIMSGPVYLHVTLKIKATHMDLFYDTMKRAVPILEDNGWTFVGAWVDRVGRLNTVIDLWELPDANTYYSGLSAFAKHSDYPELVGNMNESITEEIVHLMDKVPYGRR